MSEAIRHALVAVVAGETLSRADAEAVMGAVLDGEVTPAQLGALLMGLRMRGETVDELTGFASAMRARVIRVHAPAGVIDTCGTGGDQMATFNISTAAALVVAAAGVPVAKHGNRAVTSASGSSDVIGALGLSVETSAEEAEASLAEVGFGFLHAPGFHPGMRHAGPTRRELGVRTAFNLCGPIANPAMPARQLVGVADPASAERVAHALLALGVERAFVVHGDRIDELPLDGSGVIYDVTAGRRHAADRDAGGRGPAARRQQRARGRHPGRQRRDHPRDLRWEPDGARGRRGGTQRGRGTGRRGARGGPCGRRGAGQGNRRGRAGGGARGAAARQGAGARGSCAGRGVAGAGRRGWRAPGAAAGMTATADPVPRSRAARNPVAGGAAGVLDEIAARRRADIERELGHRTYADLAREAASAPEPRDQLGRLLRPGLHLIAEIKRRSPSAGTLAEGRLDVAERARAYAAGGASAISVLVEPHWFGGSLDDIAAARDATSLPILAKEFVVDPRQLPLVRAAGADLVLLLAVLHPRARRLARLVAQARDLGLEPLVEVHDERELESAVASGARLIGINNRDLRTLRSTRSWPSACAHLVPDDRLVVAESGVRDESRLRRWRRSASTPRSSARS